WEQVALPIEARHLDVLLNPGFTAPLLAACPMVTVFHDLQHLRQPQNFRWFDLPFWRLLLWGAAHRSAHVLADSEATRDDVLGYYGLPAEKVTVAPLGVDAEFFGLARDPRPYLLTASTLHPHKNLEALLDAFAAFRRERPEFRLAIAGVRGFHTTALERRRAELGLERAVDFTGWIPRADLVKLFAGAHAFVYPSRFEGFGLPVAEALAAGIPTACSRIPPLEAIAGDAAVLFDPDDPAAMAEAIRRVATDEAVRARLAVEGPRRASAFTWERTARITLDALEGAAGAG
ncbi:MAG: glycosyltransferase family 4 protein, partial [Bryobacteraceae bacterium]